MVPALSEFIRKGRGKEPERRAAIFSLGKSLRVFEVNTSRPCSTNSETHLLSLGPTLTS